LWKFASVELLFVACRTQRATTSEQQFVCAVSSQKVNPILISPLLASDHIPYREEDDLNIEAEAPVLHVHHVVLHALLHETGLAGFTAVTVNLGIAGDTGRHEVPYAIAFNLLGVFFQLADHVGPGADDGHVAQEYVHKLRQLVQVGLPQELSNARNAGVVLGSLKFRVGVDRHSPELIAFEQLVLLRSEEHTSELQSRENLVCRLLLQKKKS